MSTTTGTSWVASIELGHISHKHHTYHSRLDKNTAYLSCPSLVIEGLIRPTPPWWQPIVRLGLRPYEASTRRPTS